MLLVLVGLGGGYWVYQNKDMVMEKLRQVIVGLSPQLADLLGMRGRKTGTNRIGGSHSSGSSSFFNGVSSKQVDAGSLREARMKRFAVLDDSGNVISSTNVGSENEKGAISAHDNASSEVEPLPPLNLNHKED